jgi:hypothetical protein
MNCYYVDSTDVCRCTEKTCHHMDSQTACCWYEPEYIPTLTPYTPREFALDVLYGSGVVGITVAVILIIRGLLRLLP